MSRAVELEQPLNICCAKCTRPIDDVPQFRIGRFIYGACCIELAEIEAEDRERKQ